MGLENISIDPIVKIVGPNKQFQDTNGPFGSQENNWGWMEFKLHEKNFTRIINFIVWLVE